MRVGILLLFLFEPLDLSGEPGFGRLVIFDAAAIFLPDRRENVFVFFHVFCISLDVEKNYLPKSSGSSATVSS